MPKVVVSWSVSKGNSRYSVRDENRLVIKQAEILRDPSGSLARIEASAYAKQYADKHGIPYEEIEFPPDAPALIPRQS